MRSQKANTLLSTLSALALLTTLGLVLAQMSVEHLALTTIELRRQEALDHARSVASLALARLSQNADFRGQAILPEGGWVFFEPSEAARYGVPYSLNNLKSTRAQPGSLGTAVAPATAQIVAVGRSGGQSRRLEVILAVPPFPFAVAASGPIQARHGVEIAGVQALPSDGSINPALLGEADLVSNDSSSQAVVLGTGTRIRGSVQAVGQVVRDSQGVEVTGSVHSQADHEALPQQDLRQYDPLTQGWEYNAIEVDQLQAAQISGRRRKAGGLTVRDGLRLDGALLFVDGDLHVQGGLRGRGAVVATGNVTLEGQSQFASGNAVAILAGGDARIRGSGSQGSFFQGLVYTRGQFQADRVTLIGSLIAAGQQTGVELSETRLLHSPQTWPSLNGPDATVGPQLGRFSFNVFDLENGVGPTPVTVTLNQATGGVWVDLGAGRELVEADASAIVDHITQSLGGYSWGPLLNRLQTALGSYNPGWTAPPDPQPDLLDPSRFLRLEERIRVALWREDR